MARGAIYEFRSKKEFQRKLDDLKRQGYYVREATLMEVRFGVGEARKLAIWYTSDDLDQWEGEKTYFIEVFD